VSRQPSDPHSPSDRSSASRGPSTARSASGSGPTPPALSRRRLLALAGGGGLLTTAGCLSALGSSGESNVDLGLGLGRLAFADGFDSEAASLAETYGEHGVWGLADGASVDGPAYVGAIRDSLSVPGGDGSSSDGSGGGEAGDPADSEGAERDPWVTADLAAVVYRFEGSVYRVWLWAGARARQPDGGLGRASVTRVSIGATAREGWTLTGFAPRGSFRDGPVPVSLDDRGPSGRTPLPGGGIGPDEGARTGSNGRFEVAWQGIARGTRSANAVCEFEPVDGGDSFAATITFGVAGGRGAL
jgi:hypothetical protein